jgi:exo-beta-1,3-glucanase (GH17 family)
VVVVDTVYAIAQAPEVVVYVDQNGNPVQTSIQSPTATLSIWSHGSLSTIHPSSSSTPVPAPSSTSIASSPSVAAAAPVVQAVQSVAAAVASSSASSSGSSGFGTAYAPFTASGGCKSQTQVNQDVAGFAGFYSSIRIYGTSCNQVATVLQAAKSHGMKLFAGVENLSDLNSELQAIIAAANGDWSSFHTIAIGNELVNSGIASPATVINALGTARGILTAAGFTGNLVTVDTMAATLNYPQLADASDYAAVNCHPFFDPNTAPEDSGSFIENQMSLLKAKLSNPNKQIVITETGYPHAGSSNGKAVPSPSNQAAALSSIKSKFSSAVFFLSAYDDAWKTSDASTFYAEQHWGDVSINGGIAPSN